MAAKATRTRPARKQAAKSSARKDAGATWTFMSNHTHVLLCLHEDPELTLREVATTVGITERSVQRILSDLEESGYVQREKVGLRNRYRFKLTAPLRHPLEAHCRIGDIIDLIESKRR